MSKLIMAIGAWMFYVIDWSQKVDQNRQIRALLSKVWDKIYFILALLTTQVNIEINVVENAWKNVILSMNMPSVLQLSCSEDPVNTT